MKHKLYEIWNKVPVDYYQTGTRKNFLQRIWHQHKIDSAVKVLKNLNFSTCLDVGCASGYMIYEISKRFPNAKYFGVDVFDKAINYAKRQYPQIDFKVASADKLPFKDDTFDLVLFYETIEHVEDPLLCLKEIKRVTSENGTLVLAMDSGSLLFRIVWFVWENTFGRVWQEAHLHPFTHEELEDLILKSGFKIQNKFFTFLGMEVTFILKK